MNYNSDSLDGISEREIEIVRKLVEEGDLSLDVELWEDEMLIGLFATQGTSILPIGSRSLQPMISHEIFVLANIGKKGGEDTEMIRGRLFAVAGRLRELARIAEEQARGLNPNIANRRDFPLLQTVNDDEESNDETSPKPRQI